MSASDHHIWAERALIAAGLGAWLVALFHAVALFLPDISEPSPPWRHALFVGVNLAFGTAFVLRARWLPIPFGILAAQQVWSHGSDFLAARAVGHLDVQSVAVLVTLPCVAIAIAFGRR